jgi:putative oxidoreductase
MAATSALRRYIIRTSLFMAGYVAVNAAAIAGAFDDVEGPGAWLLGLAVAAPVAGQIWATLALIRDSDEFVRALTARRFILAAGLAMALFSAWGFCESYANAPHAPGWLVYPLFWLVYGLVSPMVRSTRG